MTQDKAILAQELYYVDMDFLEQENFVSAEKLFRKSWALQEHARATLRLADCVSNLGRRSESGEWLSRAYSLKADHSQIASRWAGWLFDSGSHEDSIKIVKEVLAKNPTYGPALKLLKRSLASG